jgi:hypothetical protein
VSREWNVYQEALELIEHARENPRELTVGIGSAGSLDQLVLQQFQDAVGIEVRTVPHEGGGAAVTALLGQHVDAVMGEPGQALAHLQEGTLRMLVVFQESRLDGYDAPTLQELGYDVVSTKYRGVFGPPDVPPETVAAIEEALQQIYDVEPFKSYYENASLEPVFMGHEEFVRLLLRHQPDLASRVTVSRPREIAQLLFEHGMDPNRPNWLRITPLHYFAETSDVESAALFLDHGADINAREEEWSATPLGWAAHHGHALMVEFLLRRGAKTRLPDDPPWATPLAWATRRGHSEVAALLQ